MKALAAFVVGVALLPAGAHAATLKRTTLACTTKVQFDRAWGEVANQDWNALAKQEAAGECVNLQQGKTVSIIAHEGVLSTTVKIRLRGSAATWWTDISFLQLNKNDK